ncbi:MAG: hypothetical protein FJZ92_05935 [Chloroflexi bacterium]|nr:hypothetical protein [Chloroflexota bacterium]
MGSVVTDRRADDAGWVRVVVARAAPTAERWRAALEAEEVAVESRIEDVREALPGQSTLPGAIPDVPPFAYSLYVAPDDVQRARRALIDAGWDGRTGLAGASRVSTRGVLGGALLAIAGAAALLWFRASLG